MDGQIRERGMDSGSLDAVTSAYLAHAFDPEFRERMLADPQGALASTGRPLPPGVEVRVHVNTADTFYLPFPPDPNVALSDESLGMVAGGKSASTVGSTSSASTLACLCGTASTGGSASTMASAASASSGS